MQWKHCTRMTNFSLGKQAVLKNTMAVLDKVTYNDLAILKTRKDGQDKDLNE